MNRNNRTNTIHTKKRINANIYSIIEAVNDSIAPGEEKLVPLIVKHIIESRSAEPVH
jgi:hypothetical protein